MIWLTFRQHRWEALVTALAVAVLAFLNLIPGLRAPAVAASLQIPACLAGGPITIGGSCSAAFDQFDRQFGWTHFFPGVFVALPALVAPFLGAPLVAREHEFRTSLLVWAQGVTRTRWIVTKLALFALPLAGCAIVLAAVASVAAQAWNFRPMRWQDTYEWSPAVMLGTTFLALALGVFAGVLTRRVLAAMLVALVLVAGVRAGVVSQIRPNFVAPIVATSQRDIPPDAWLIGSTYIDAGGNTVPIDRLLVLNLQLRNQGPPYPNPDEYYAVNGVYFRGRYQPKEREAQLQAMEFGLYAGLSVLLLGASVWLVRRRPA